MPLSQLDEECKHSKQYRVCSGKTRTIKEKVRRISDEGSKTKIFLKKIQRILDNFQNC